MTDNQTTELQSLSKLKMAGKLRYWRGTIEIPENELHAICNEIQAEHEQAIAATLRGEKPYYTDRDDNGNHITCAQCGEYLGTAEEFAAMTGEKRCFATDYTHEHCKYSVDRGWTEDTKFYIPTVRRGTLTPEQVCKCVLSVYYDGYNDGSVHRGQGVNEIDWPAITNRLNAELGNEMCETASMRDTVDWNGEPMTEHMLEYGESKKCCVLHVFKGKAVK